MTKITIVRSNGYIRSFTLEGHAGYAIEGEDIVCAAISMLVINTINSIEKLTKDAFKCENDEDTGYIHWECTEEPSEATKVLLEAMLIGLTDVRNEYGQKYLRLEFKEV